MIVHGSTGRAVLKYATDMLELHQGTGVTVRKYERADLLEEPGRPIARIPPYPPEHGPLSATGGFTKVVEAVRVAEAPAEIPATLVRWEGEGLERHTSIGGRCGEVDRPGLRRAGVVQRTRGAVDRHSIETGRVRDPEPRLQPRHRPVDPGHRRRDGELFTYVYAATDPQLESPRPYIHPLRTLDGDLVSIYRPHDHVWHKGITWSLPHFGHENFWGG